MIYTKKNMRMKRELRNPGFHRDLCGVLRPTDRKTEDQKREKEIPNRASDVSADDPASRRAYKLHTTSYRKTIIVFIASDGRFSKADRSSGKKSNF